MVSLWILNKKISGSIVSATRHAIREALFSMLPPSDPAHHQWESILETIFENKETEEHHFENF